MDLTKPPEKIFVFSIVGVVLVLWVLIWLLGPKPEVIKPEVQLPISLAGLKSQPVQQEEKPAEELMDDTWGRDPFAVPYQAVEAEGGPKPEEAARRKPTVAEGRPQYKLSTILIAGTSRLAVINDRVYTVGDQIGSEKIASITLEHVVLTDGSAERLLKVPQPQTKVTVQEKGRK